MSKEMNTQNLISYAILAMFVFAVVMTVRAQRSKNEEKANAMGCGCK